MDGPFAEPTNTREAILGAAFRALRKHGYASVTIQRIGDEFDKSPSLVYHHYDGKDDLLVDLMGFLLDEFEASISDSGDPPPVSGGDSQPVDESDPSANSDGAEAPPERSARDELDIYLTAAVDPESLDGAYAPDAQFVTVMTELRAQAANDEAYREHFDRSDRVFGEYLERLVREAAAETEAPDGHAAGASPPSVPVGEVVAILQTFATGGMFRWTTTNGGAWVDDSRAGIDGYLERVLPLVETDEAD
ncbi:TetR family transcriptional regulator [Halorubrum ezzemoulense]|uniref:TetR family transcriptional regulator n=1 Tax=Halorubrum ezzemoulense TaxID=337243 RepID=A0A256IS98_HALEZ|nr:TetR/AcrR family transcriptional regulator [Halorubrum ezzemoulense]OYR59012.1 TetR family transcriptional regulator [Halorubrum ezzemoulense]